MRGEIVNEFLPSTPTCELWIYRSHNGFSIAAIKNPKNWVCIEPRLSERERFARPGYLVPSDSMYKYNINWKLFLLIWRCSSLNWGGESIFSCEFLMAWPSYTFNLSHLLCSFALLKRNLLNCRANDESFNTKNKSWIIPWFYSEGIQVESWVVKK